MGDITPPPPPLLYHDRKGAWCTIVVNIEQASPCAFALFGQFVVEGSVAIDKPNRYS